MYASQYARTYGRSAHLDARDAGHFAARNGGTSPADWLGLEVKSGRYLNDELRSWYLSGWETGQKINRQQRAA
jgi:hypothetical protein